MKEKIIHANPIQYNKIIDILGYTPTNLVCNPHIPDNEAYLVDKDFLIQPYTQPNLKGAITLENVKVYQLNENDGVAAESLEQAKEYYSKMTGLSDEDAFYDYTAQEIPLDQEMWKDESMTEKETLSDVVKEHWKGKPFIAFSSEY